MPYTAGQETKSVWFMEPQQGTIHVKLIATVQDLWPGMPVKIVTGGGADLLTTLDNADLLFIGVVTKGSKKGGEVTIRTNSKSVIWGLPRAGTEVSGPVGVISFDDSMANTMDQAMDNTNPVGFKFHGYVVAEQVVLTTKMTGWALRNAQSATEPFPILIR